MNFFKGFRCIGVVVLLCCCKSDAAINAKEPNIAFSLNTPREINLTTETFRTSPFPDNLTTTDLTTPNSTFTSEVTTPNRTSTLSTTTELPTTPSNGSFKFSKEEVENAVQDSLMKQQIEEEKLQELENAGVLLTLKDAGFLSSTNKKIREELINVTINAEVATKATLFLAESKKIPMSERTSIFRAANLTINTKGPCSSDVQLPCDASSKYRTIDGSCNNLGNPRWGKAHIPYLRYLENDYDNKINSPRGIDAMLPSARDISQNVLGEMNMPHKSVSHMVMQWGQFLAHDMAHTPVKSGYGGSQISCCINGTIRPRDDFSSSCFPISISEDDPQFGPLKITCMEFTRSEGIRNSNCSLGPREQLNQLSAYIDGSNVYSSDFTRADILREQTLNKGFLKFFEEDDRDLLPPIFDGAECKNTDKKCFEAGDIRVNEQAGLSVMHIVWMREHNRVATELMTYNPSWDDEKLYQEARRIVWAEMQHITYNEWLPVILGLCYMETHSLTCESPHWYDPKIDASITNSFATAAFRYGHSLIQGMIDMYSEFEQHSDSLRLRDIAFRNEHLYEPKMMDAHIRGLANQKCQKGDRNFDPEIRHHLFEPAGQTVGLDLAALNIQRGRDHGIPSYVEFRRICGLTVPTSFEDLKIILDSPKAKSVKQLESMYDSVEDIDLYVGGMMEKSATGALVGQTFQCLIGDQFKRLRFGDRFFYLDQDNLSVTKFTAKQLKEIKKVTMARILCDNSDDIVRIKKNVFNVGGTRVSCHDGYMIKRIHIGEWAE